MSNGERTKQEILEDIEIQKRVKQAYEFEVDYWDFMRRKVQAELTFVELKIDNEKILMRKTQAEAKVAEMQLLREQESLSDTREEQAISKRLMEKIAAREGRAESVAE